MSPAIRSLCKKCNLTTDIFGLQPSQITAQTRLSAADKSALNDAVKGLKVRVSHREGIVRVYRVNALVDAADMLRLV